MSTRGSGSGRRVAVGTALGLVAAALTVLVPAAPAAAAGLVVTTAADVVADDGVCSLREAIEAADTDTASGAAPGECPAGSGADVITFGVAGPVVGASFFIDSDVTIDGGSDGIVIDGGSGGSLTGPVFIVAGRAIFDSVTITGANNPFFSGGGGILNSGTTAVLNSTITNNVSPVGAGIATFGGAVTIVNSTISNNALGQGVAIIEQSSVSIEFSTIVENDAGGIWDYAFATNLVSVSASIVQDPALPTVSVDEYSVIGGDPGLGPLGDNGGPTHTHALMPGSPALDRVTAAVGSDPVVDQRGIARPQGTAKDSGAFERDEVVLLPGGFGTAEGQSGSQVFEIPISLSRPSTETITVDYVSWPCEIFDGCGDGLATQGVDYADPGTGTLTFLPGETTKTVPVTVFGDLDVEPAYLWGEWFLIRFLDPSPNAVLDPSFFGLGAGVIGNDDP